jgi:hypothetical protein
MTNLASTLVLILISIAIGFLFGALVYGLRSKPSQQSGAGEEKKASAGQGVRLWRDPQTQNLSVEVDGKTYHQVGELGPEERSRLAGLARDWQRWLGLPLSRLAAMASPPSQVSAEQLSPIQAGSEPVAGAQPTPGKALDRTPAKPPRGAEKSKADTAPESIAAQIDAILQARIENTPLGERGIKLQDIPGQGLVVMVGQEQYTDLTLVPDQQARAAIAEAVAEWEKKNTPWSQG